MNTKAAIASLLLALIPMARAATGDFITQGRAYLAGTNLIAANNSFSNAVVLSPNDATGNVFYAATRLLVLPLQPAGSNFLNRLGVPVSGRNIYHWGARLPHDTNGIPLAPAGVNANESTAMLRTNVLAALVAAEANLARVTDANFLLALTSSETRGSAVTVDYGDVQLLRAMIWASEYFVYTTHSWNLDAQVAALRSLYTNHQFSVESLFKEYPGLLTFATTNDLDLGKTAFLNGVNRYMAASQFIRSRPPDVIRLFNTSSRHARKEEDFRLTLADLTNSLHAVVASALDPHFHIFMASQFDGAHPVRSFLPQFHGNGFVVGSLPDPSFGGLIHGVSADDVDRLLAHGLVPIPQLRSPSRAGGVASVPINGLSGRGYVVQVSTNLLDWLDYGAFYAAGGTYVFEDATGQETGQRFYRVVERTGSLPPPPNDNFADRIPLAGIGITALGYNDNASAEANEPGNAWQSVWWSWTSPFSGPVVIKAEGSSAYSYLDPAVYTGSSLDSLAPISLDYTSSGPVFYATAGATYQIQVGSYGGPGGIKLTITAPPFLFVTSPPDGEVSPEPTNFLISASAVDVDGTISELELFGDGRPLALTTNTGLTFLWTNVSSGFHQIRVTATDNLGVKSSVDLTVTVRPPNDDFAHRIPITGGSATVSGSNDGASQEDGEPVHAGIPGGVSVWWTWTAPFTGPVTIFAEVAGQWGPYYTLLGVYEGDSVSSLTEVASSGPIFDGGAQASFIAAPGVAYQIAVDGEYQQYGDITLRILHTAPPSVSIIAPLTGSVFVGPTNVILTASAMDDGTISRVDFLQDSYYALIGTVTNAPYSITWSNVSFGDYTLTARAVDNSGAQTFSDPISISVTHVMPQNDNFVNRTPLLGSAATVFGSNAGATKELGEPAHAGIPGGVSVWWTWTAPKTGSVSISTSGSDFDTLLGVYTGSSVSTLTLVAGNNNYNGQQTSLVVFTATSGRQYQIAVDGYYGASGNITLSLTQP